MLNYFLPSPTFAQITLAHDCIIDTLLKILNFNRPMCCSHSTNKCIVLNANIVRSEASIVFIKQMKLAGHKKIALSNLGHRHGLAEPRAGDGSYLTVRFAAGPIAFGVAV